MNEQLIMLILLRLCYLYFKIGIRVQFGYYATPHVALQIRFGQEPLSTYGANVGAPEPVPRMRLFMSLQRSSLCEPFPAQFTDVRFFSCMNANVLDQLVLFGEAFRAHVTCVRFVPGMGSQVELELFPAGQALSANVAEHGQINLVVLVLLYGVSPQTTGRLVVLLADGAVEFYQWPARQYFVVGGSPVRGQVPREHKVLPANFTLEWLLPGVEILVLDGVSAYSEGFGADLTFELGGALVSSNVHLQVVLGAVSVVAEVTGVLIVLAVT